MTDQAKPDESSSETPATDVPPGLDSFLESWKNSAPNIDQKALERIDALEGELTDRIISDDIVPHIRGELAVSDKLVKGFLSESAAENPELNELFRNRKAKPQDFQAALDGVRDEFQQLMGKKVEQTTEDDPNAIASAVAAARETQTETGFDGMKWGEMSAHEFETNKRALFKAVAAGQVK